MDTNANNTYDSPMLIELIEIFEGKEGKPNLICADIVRYIYNEFVGYEKLTDGNIQMVVKGYFRNKKKIMFMYGPIDYWDVSEVKFMDYLFFECEAITNENLNNWDTSNVVDMSCMFYGAINFNGNVGGWNVQNVRNMYSMFENAHNFNGDIGNWDVQNVTDMGFMFCDAHMFNCNISNWNISKVTRTTRMFEYAYSFDRYSLKWDVSHVKNKEQM